MNENKKLCGFYKVDCLEIFDLQRDAYYSVWECKVREISRIYEDERIV